MKNKILITIIILLSAVILFFINIVKVGYGDDLPDELPCAYDPSLPECTPILDTLSE